MPRICLVLIWLLAFAACAPMASERATAVLPQDATMPTAPASGVQVVSPGAYFPIGVFEDGNITGGDLAKFATMLDDFQKHNLDAVMFTNNYAARDARLLGVSDRLGMNVYMMPAGDLDSLWWPASIHADITTARAIAGPIVDLWSAHPSLKGYVVKDEPGLGDLNKVALLTQAFHELDPTRRAMPVLIGTDRVGPIFDAAKPAVLLIDVYPTGYHNPPCDFTLTGFGYTDLDFVGYTRLVAKTKPLATPLWMILQTHSFGTGGAFSLRVPSAAEVRMQHWLAIGEGATGIFWFIYSSQQGWLGLKDSPTLFSEVSAQARRVKPLKSLLLSLHKGEDRFTIAGGTNPYVSTLISGDGKQSYAVAVNRDCQAAQKLTIRSAQLKGRLRDLESGRFYDLGQPIDVQPGDGRIFQIVRHVSELLYSLGDPGVEAFAGSLALDPAKASTPN